MMLHDITVCGEILCKQNTGGGEGLGMRYLEYALYLAIQMLNRVSLHTQFARKNAGRSNILDREEGYVDFPDGKIFQAVPLRIGNLSHGSQCFFVCLFVLCFIQL